jgi:hypothetical protein
MQKLSNILQTGKSDNVASTAYDNNKKEEATDTINAIYAKYGYAPEFSGYQKQVGAVIASINSIQHSAKKSSK